MKKPKNIPTYYNFPGTPVFRDTTALPFNYGGNLYPSMYYNSFADGGDLNNNELLPFDVYTWKGDTNSYYRKNENGDWEYLNSKTRNKEGRYDFKKVTDSKVANKLNRQAEFNPNAAETLGKWMTEEVKPYIAPGVTVKGKKMSLQEKRDFAKQRGIVESPSMFNNFFNNIENMTSSELEKKGRSMGPTAEGAKYLEMAAVQKQNEDANKYNSYIKNITTGRMHADEEQPWTYETVSPLPYSGLTEGPLITRQEKDARDFFNYLKENKDAAQQILGKELTEEELFNETGGYNNFAQSDLYTNFGNADFVNKIEDQKYQNFLAENQKAAKKAGTVYNTLDFARSLGSDFFGTVGNLLTEGKMPLYQQARGLRGEDPKLQEYYQQYMPSGLSEVDNIINFANPISSGVDAKLAYNQGNYGSAILSGLGALPLIGGLGKGLRSLKGVNKLDDWNNINWNFGKYGTAEDVAGTTNRIGGVQLANDTNIKLLEEPITGIDKILKDKELKKIVVDEHPINTKNLLSTEGKILPESASWQSIMDDFDNKLAQVDLTQPLTDAEYIKAADAINPEINKVASLEEIKALHQNALDYFQGQAQPKDIALFIRKGLAEKLVSSRQAPTMVGGFPTYSAGFSVSPALDPTAPQFFGPKSVYDQAIAAGYDINKLNPQAQNMLAAYTKKYDFDINSLLRRGVPEVPNLREGFYAENAKILLDAVLANKFPHETSVIRSIKHNHPIPLVDKKTFDYTGDVKFKRNIKKGDVLKDTSFLSTSLDENVKWGKPALSEKIIVPKGQSYAFPNAFASSSSPMEKEALFPPNLAREVVEVLPEHLAKVAGYRFVTKILNPYLAPLGIGAAAGTTGLAGNSFDQSNYNAYGNMGLTTGGKSNAYGGPLNDKTLPNLNQVMNAPSESFNRPKPNSVLVYSPYAEATKTPNQSAYIRPNYYTPNNNYKYGFIQPTEGNIIGGVGYGIPKHGLEGNLFGLAPAENNPYFKGFYSAGLSKQIGANKIGLNIGIPVTGYTDEAGFHPNKLQLEPQINFKRTFADGGPLHDRDNETGKLLNSTYASALGNMFREGGPFGEDKGTFDYANSIYASQPGNYYRTGGQFPRPYSLPEDSFKQGGNNLHNSVYASSNAQYPAIYKYGGSVLSMSNTPQLQGEGKDLTVPENAYIYAGGGLIKRADGSYSQRGLWDNIRANIGSGKKPTKQMLQQEKKINKN